MRTPRDLMACRPTRHPYAVNPLGATKKVPEGPPQISDYAWVGLQGIVPAAVILDRAGYPAFTVGDRAVLRAVEYLRYLHRVPDRGARSRSGDRTRSCTT